MGRFLRKSFPSSNAQFRKIQNIRFTNLNRIYFETYFNVSFDPRGPLEPAAGIGRKGFADATSRRLFR
ncbi:hypothetical protein FH581_001420 [Leptospira weilii]|uniref:hypothetical protein n=1 Tax=Leptospira weilii TaxID=28184 RepID=UPI00037F860D|nr:hypothetical protein [Leptospira weilii]ULH27463.1 hypothetical protein FH586_13680 [Leptospira weilii]UPY77547.1 hypothetical protein FH581_001420 [Leptospira weilii]